MSGIRCPSQVIEASTLTSGVNGRLASYQMSAFKFEVAGFRKPALLIVIADP
jgi:hypothetical protein